MLKALLAGLIMLTLVVPAMAQDEIVVTAQRRSESVPQNSGIGIKRRADFVIQRVTVYGDARERESRRKEILSTVANAIILGQKRSIQLAYGMAVIQPLTLANYADKLKFEKDDEREDVERVSFVIKTPLEGGNAIVAVDRLLTFLKAVPLVGRAVIEHDDDPGVSIVNPSQYRAQIVAAIAVDANAAAQAFGPEYRADASSLARPVQWVLIGPTEVLLYIDHELRIAPKP